MRDGWKKVAISDVCIMIKRGHAPSYTENKSVTVLNQKCIRDGRINLEFSRQTDANLKPVNEWAYLNATDTLVNSTGVGTLGRVAFVRILPERTTVDSHVTIVRPDNKKVEPSFLGLSLNFREADIEGLAAGSSGQTELSREALGNLIITLPPLPEQKRIVDLISSVDSYIEALQQQLETSENYRNALLHELLSSGGSEWVESTLGEMISYSIGGVWGNEPGNSEVDVPVYRQTEFNNSGELTTPADAIRSISKSQLQSRTLQYGDILIQKSAGTPSLPGRVVMVPDLGVEPATFSNFLNLLRPDQSKCLARFAFLHFWLKHKNGRAFEFQRGTNIKNLDLPNYLREKILLPPLKDQKRIVEIIESLDALLTKTNRAIKEAQTLRLGLVSDLLSGEHDIPSSYDKVMGAA